MLDETHFRSFPWLAWRFYGRWQHMRFSFDPQFDLPLGIDIGTSKLRMTYARWTAAGASVEAVTSRDRDAECDEDWLSSMLYEMRADLGAKTRSCAMALGSHEATIDVLTLPHMSHRDRTAAANIEAQRRYADGRDRLVRLFPTRNKERFLLATTPYSHVALRKQLAAKAGLRLTVLSIDGLTWSRFESSVLSVVDIGMTSTRIHSYDSGAPKVALYPFGGRNVTIEMARALGIDERSAEQRKRILGSSGTGEHLIEGLVAWIVASIEKGEPHSLPSVMLVGNGSRLPEIRRLLSDKLSQRRWLTGCNQLERSRYPKDIRRAAFSDWALSIALASTGSGAI